MYSEFRVLSKVAASDINAKAVRKICSGNTSEHFLMLDMFKNRLSVLEQFYNNSKIEWKMQRVPIYLLSSHVQPLLLSTFPHQSGTL